MTNDGKHGITKRGSELEIYLGKPVKIETASHSLAMGIVESISIEYISLRPSLINQGLYNPENKLIDNYKYQDKLPQKVKLLNITTIEPLDEGYLERLAENVNSVSANQALNKPKV